MPAPSRRRGPHPWSICATTSNGRKSPAPKIRLDFITAMMRASRGRTSRISERATESEARPNVKRKISAILAADIAGYSRLVAEDEEETLRRLAIYRAVFDDFVARWGGRIFNTAGDAVLA